jgi:hypothetical protein
MPLSMGTRPSSRKRRKASWWLSGYLMAALLPRRGVEVERRVLVADVPLECPEPEPAGLRVVEHGQPRAVQVHDDGGEDRVDRRPPQRPQQVGGPRDLVGEGRHGKLDPQALEALLLPMQRQAVPVLVYQQLAHERGAHAAGGDDLVAQRRAYHLRLAVETGHLLPLVEANDDLGGDEVFNPDTGCTITISGDAESGVESSTRRCTGMQLLRVGNSVTIPVAETIVHWLESDESDSLLQLLIPGPDSAGGQGEGSISVSSEPNGRIPDFVSNCNASYAPTSSKAWGLHGSGGSCTITISSRTQAEPYYVVLLSF